MINKVQQPIFIPDIESELTDSRHAARIAADMVELHSEDLPEEVIYAVYHAARVAQATYDKYHGVLAGRTVRIIREDAA